LTCIVALRDELATYMVCDSAWTIHGKGLITTAATPSKVISIPIGDTVERALVGVCGSGGILCVLTQAFKDYQLDSSATFRTVYAEIYEQLEAKDLWDVFEGRDKSEILIAIAGKLYSIHDRYTYIELAEKFTAMGSGADIALGALYALQASKQETWADTSKNQVMAAMQASAAFDVGVKAPFHLFTTVPTAVSSTCGD